MILNTRKGSDTVNLLTCHIVWSTKYSYKVLQGGVKIRFRELLIQGFGSYGIETLKGVISSDRMHLN